MREYVLKDLNIPQKDIDEIFILIAETIEKWDMETSLSQALLTIRDPENPVHDYLYHAFLISESGCDPEVTDILLEIAQRKIEMEKVPSFRQVSQILCLRTVVPYIEKRPNRKRLLDILNQLCSHDTAGAVTIKIESLL